MQSIGIYLAFFCLIASVASQNVLMGDKTEDFLQSIQVPSKSNLDLSAPDNGNDIQTIGVIPFDSSIAPSTAALSQSNNVPLNLNPQLSPGFMINSSPQIMLPTIQGSSPISVNPGISTDNYYFNDHQIANALDPPYKKKLIQTRNIIQSAQDNTRATGNFLAATSPISSSVNNAQMLSNVNANSLLNQNPYKQLYQIPMSNIPYQMGALNGL